MKIRRPYIAVSDYMVEIIYEVYDRSHNDHQPRLGVMGVALLGSRMV